MSVTRPFYEHFREVVNLVVSYIIFNPDSERVNTFALVLQRRHLIVRYLLFTLMYLRQRCLPLKFDSNNLNNHSVYYDR